MNTEHATLEKHLKKSQLWSNSISAFVAILTASSVGYGFYYNTKNAINTHTEEIRELKQDVNEVKAKSNESAVFQGVSNAQIKALEDKVSSIDAKMDKMDDKLDQILIKK
jgi:hypothetical protein